MAIPALAQACVDRTALATGLDDAIFTSHWYDNTATGPPDHAGRLSATAKLRTFWGAVGGYVHTSHVFREVKWYSVDPTPPYRTHFIESLPIGTLPGDAGSSGGSFMPPQTAISVTFKTASRKHWGRFYLPGATVAALDTTTHKGAIATTVCDAIAVPAAVLCSTSSGAPGLCVWSPKLGTSEGVLACQVDNVFDVVRRRRMKVSTYKKTQTVT